jgi:HAD superfamily hydrolase (TIGR01509 family)
VFQAVIFDFDGTILDTETPEFEAWQAAYQTHGVVLPADLWRSVIGLGATDGAARFHPGAHLEELLGRPLSDDERTARRAHYYAMIDAQSVRPGIETWLADAQRLGIFVAVASSGTRGWVRGNLERLGLLTRFGAVFCGDDVARTKPWPDLYIAAAAALGVRPENAIAIEDSPNGIRAAKAAGCFCIACPNPMTAPLDLYEADRIVASLADLSLESLLAL